MPKSFIGREDELKKLETAYQSPESKLVVVYGRRRIGKSALIERFVDLYDKPSLQFEGIEQGNTEDQIGKFLVSLAEQLEDPYIEDLNLKTWDKVFKFLTDRVLKNRRSKKKFVIFLDEIQWLAVKRTKLISLLKFYWDKHWKHMNIMLVLCGSIASFMVNRVIFSKALYGRIDLEILLRSLDPDEAYKFFGSKRNKEEILKYLMLFGCIPRYLELIKTNQSFSKNIEELCFEPEGYMFKEPGKIFYSQFRETEKYEEIVHALKDKILTYKEILDAVRHKSGGGFKTYLNNLENAEIISQYSPSNVFGINKLKKYKLSDEFLTFYFKYIEPNKNKIKKAKLRKLFDNLVKNQWNSWLGFAFERFCLRHAVYLADKMGFGDELIDYSPYFRRGDRAFQVDLIYFRIDKTITVCEIKYWSKKVSTSIIPEMQTKLKLLPKLNGFTVEKALISIKGMDNALKESQYFDHSLTISDFL